MLPEKLDKTHVRGFFERMRNHFSVILVVPNLMKEKQIASEARSVWDNLEKYDIPSGETIDKEEFFKTLDSSEMSLKNILQHPQMKESGIVSSTNKALQLISLMKKGNVAKIDELSLDPRKE